MKTFAFDNSYAHLPARFYAHVLPTKVKAPQLVKLNTALAEELGLTAAAIAELGTAKGAAIFAGNDIPEGADPIALAYAGHQFGNFVPQLGDGRAVLLGEVVGTDGKRRDIQLKGAGRTPFSRGGDGRAALGPVLREYLVSEAMAALGIPTTRALAAVTTGELVARDEMLPGAIVTRVAKSHLRVGTFQFFAARSDREALSALTTYALERHYPDAAGTGNDALALLERVTRAQADLVARWLGVGFVHGVMNTDNSSISGETIDYGPCAFLDIYDPKKVFSSIDRGGRYAFANQPRIAQWNLARLAEALLPILAPGEEEEKAIELATATLDTFPAVFEAAHGRVLRAKLGIFDSDRQGDLPLAADILERMATNDVDFTLFFRRLCASAADPAADAAVAPLFSNPGAFHEWAERWRARLATDDAAPAARRAAMERANPAFIPRNHRVEEVLAAATTGDYGPFETLLGVLANPYDDQPDAAHLAEPPPPNQPAYRTFCGT